MLDAGYKHRYVVARLLPVGVLVTWLADRAFGTPAFTDLVVAHGWHYVVRVQGQTRYRDCNGRAQEVQALVAQRHQRRKPSGRVFKKAGWRLIGLYRWRYPIEGTFRDYKSAGWQWEQGQVTDLQHLERLLVGTQVAAELLAQPPTGRRRTRPWAGKYSLFQLGLQHLQQWLSGRLHVQLACRLTDWQAPNWQAQICCHHAQAFVFARHLPS